MSQLTPDAITDEALFQPQDELSGEPATDVVEQDEADVGADVDSLVLSRTETFQPVDDALRNWRTESARRIAEHAEQSAERGKKRRRQVTVVGGLLAVVAGVAAVMSQPGTATNAGATVLEAPLNDASVIVTAAETAPEPVDETAPEPVVETAPVPVVETAPEPVVETVPAAAAGAFDPRIVEGTLTTWVAGDTAWIQFDFLGSEPLTLRWTDRAGATAISDVVCDNRIDAATGRCYVGRNGDTIDWGLAQGAQEGPWNISACGTGGCAEIATFLAPI